VNFLHFIDKHIASGHQYRPSVQFSCSKCDGVEVARGGMWFIGKGQRVFVPDCYKPQEIAQ